jgi:hypothetical protein
VNGGEANREEILGAFSPGGAVSAKTLQEHYGIWRWKIERESSNRLVQLWARIGESSLPDDTKVRLADVAWALGAFERAFDVLMADMGRAERARSDGVPPVMGELTGPYENSLDYLLGMGLWMDLGDVLVAYRTICKRIDKVLRQGGVLRRATTKWTRQDVDDQVAMMQARTLQGLGADKVTIMASTVLHHTWEPSAQRDMGLQVYWKGPNHQTVDFAADDVREALTKLVEETLEQVYVFITAQL